MIKNVFLIIYGSIGAVVCLVALAILIAFAISFIRDFFSEGDSYD